LIETVPDLPAGTLGFRASGKISSDEYRQMMEPIYAALKRGEKLNIYFELAEDFHGLDSGALWQDLQAAGSVGLKHRSSWERMALVTDKDWVRHGASAFGWLAPGELRLFEQSEGEEARAWLGATPSLQTLPERSWEGVAPPPARWLRAIVTGGLDAPRPRLRG
jgi:hypothetical protein